MIRAKRWIGILLIVMMAISMLSGCKSADTEEGASVGEFVAGEQQSGNEGADQGDQNAPADQGAGGSSEPEKEQNSQKPAAQPDADSGSEKDEGGSNGESNAPKPAEKPDQDGGSEKDEGGSNEDEGGSDEDEEFPQWEEPEDPYANIPISKTPAKTADGISYYKENYIKVVSQNILVGGDGENSISERMPRLEKILNQYDPDVIGFQEYTPNWSEMTDFILSDKYEYVNEWRSVTNQEGTPILWKKEKFELLDWGYFWLSETPETESKGWGATYYRICDWVKLRVRQTGAEFYYFNTHFDFNEKAQVGSAELILKRAKQCGSNAAVILSADFNMNWKAAGYKKLETYFSDVNTERDPSITYQGLKHTGGSLIDFTFVTPKTIKPMKYQVMNDLVDGKFVSDHYGVYSEVIILQK